MRFGRSGLDERNNVFHIDLDEDVECFVCKERKRLKTVYKHGEAFLCGPSHYPRNGEANYICKEHLDDDAVICVLKETK